MYIQVVDTFEDCFSWMFIVVPKYISPMFVNYADCSRLPKILYKSFVLVDNINN